MNDFQDILERQEQIQDLDKHIELKQLELQHFQKHESRNLTSASALQCNPVPGPAAFQNATPIMLVNDPDQATSTGGKSSLFQVLCPCKIVSRQRWPHHYIPFGMSQKSYKELSMPEFLYGYLSILLEFPDEIHQNELLLHLRDLMRLSVFYKWDAVCTFHSACLSRIKSGRSKWGDSFDKEVKLNILESHRLPLQKTASSVHKKSSPTSSIKEYFSDWNRSGFCTNTSDENHVSSLHVCAYCQKPDHCIGACVHHPDKREK